MAPTIVAQLVETLGNHFLEEYITRFRASADNTTDKTASEIYCALCTMSKTISMNVTSRHTQTTDTIGDIMKNKDRIVVTSNDASPLDWISIIRWAEDYGRADDVRFVLTDQIVNIDFVSTIVSSLTRAFTDMKELTATVDGAGINAVQSYMSKLKPTFYKNEDIRTGVEKYRQTLNNQDKNKSGRYILVLICTKNKELARTAFAAALGPPAPGVPLPTWLDMTIRYPSDYSASISTTQVDTSAFVPKSTNAIADFTKAVNDAFEKVWDAKGNTADAAAPSTEMPSNPDQENMIAAGLALLATVGYAAWTKAAPVVQ
jgi:hypothetical protein